MGAKLCSIPPQSHIKSHPISCQSPSKLSSQTTNQRAASPNLGISKLLLLSVRNTAPTSTFQDVFSFSTLSSFSLPPLRPSLTSSPLFQDHAHHQVKLGTIHSLSSLSNLTSVLRQGKRVPILGQVPPVGHLCPCSSFPPGVLGLAFLRLSHYPELTGNALVRF